MMDTLIAIAVALQGPIGVLVAALSYPVLGWLKNAAEDGKFEAWEWRMLVQTVIAVSIPALGIYYGLDMMGFDANGVAAGFTVLLFDYVAKLFVKKQPTVDSKKVK